MSATFDPEQVRVLAQILADTGLTEIEVEASFGRIRVARAHPPAVQAAAIPSSVTVLPAAATQPAAMLPTTPEDAALHPGAVLSPMVGIAYLSPEPGAPPFVQLGQEVTAGQTVVLIEAMKTFNQIKAPKSGTVRRILVGPGTPVEYGEPLLIVE